MIIVDTAIVLLARLPLMKLNWSKGGVSIEITELHCSLAIYIYIYIYMYNSPRLEAPPALLSKCKPFVSAKHTSLFWYLRIHL